MAERKELQVSHAGHRQRMKERYLVGGLEGFSGHEVLELLLYYAIPYKDTNPLAHRLENAFGSLSNVLEADYADLLQVPGVTPHIATLLCLCGDVARRYNSEITGRVNHLHDYRSLEVHIKPWFFGEREESVVLVSLDNKRKWLNTTRIFTGNASSSQFHVRLAVQQALRDNATKVVLAHNHPGGYAVPSLRDVETTRHFIEALDLLGITLLDHLVVSENECLSMAHLPETAHLFPPP